MKPAAAALAVLALAAATASCSKPSDAQPAASSSAKAANVGAPAADGRRVDITVGPEGYVPATIQAKAGESLVLRFTRTTKSECLSEVVFPDLKIKKELPMNTTVEIPVKADKPGKIAFQCGMAMVHGHIDVSGS